MKINLEIIRIEEASSKAVALFLSKRCSMQENMRRYEKNEELFLVQTSPSNQREQGSSDKERKYMVFSKTSQFYSIAALSYSNLKRTRFVVFYIK
jgi:hypothetical protein